MIQCDVAIVGGGIIGSSIAFELARKKVRVLLLDRQQPGREASWAAAGLLSPAPDTPDFVPVVPLAKESFALYPQFIAAVEEASGKPTGFRRDGSLYLYFGPHAEDQRDRTVMEHLRLGLASETLHLDGARRIEPKIGPSVRAAAWLPYENSVEPRLLTEAVLAAAKRRGARILPGVTVTSVLREGSRCTGVVAGGEKIETKHVIVAAGSFSAEIDGIERYAPTRPVRGQMVALHPSNCILRCALRAESGYLVPRNDGRIIAGSTLENAGFDKSITPAGLQKILAAAVEIMPALAEAPIVETWAGLRPDTPDHLPVIGPTDVEGLLIATGHYRNGILLAPVTARLLCDWIVDGRASLSAEAYSPLRFAREQQSASH
jgi:glycine oxidase